MELRYKQPKQDSYMARTIEMDNQIDAVQDITTKFEASRG